MSNLLSPIISIILLVGPMSSFADSGYLRIGTLNVHYGVFQGDQGAIGDVLFFNGYGDTFDNHALLFREWNKKGLRVISFDYPSHGKTSGHTWDDLEWHSFHSIATIAKSVRDATLEDPNRPLILAGWSTGGLLAVRIAQSKMLNSFFPNVSGLILFAPGISVRKCVGNRFCHITNDTLTHNQSLQNRDIHPKSPLYRPNFAAKLLFNSHRSQNSALPSSLPTLIFVAGFNEDRYVNSAEIIKWVYHQRQNASANIKGFQCQNARHELDNEPSIYGGSFVRETAAEFAASVVSPKSEYVGKASTLCKEF